MSQKIMQECFEQSYSQKWEHAGDQEKAVWETAWYASRATLIVELPGGLMLRSEIKPILEAAGIQVKP